MARRLLFVTWDGPQSFYLESLFLPILAALRDSGIDSRVLQFTWGATAKRTAVAADRAGIGYEAVEVLRRPLALGSFATAIWGARHVRRVVRRHGIDLLMPRSILPALSCLLARKTLPYLPFLFDADGLPVDERVDFAGADPHRPDLRLLWAIERAAVRAADAVTTRSVHADVLLAERAHLPDGTSRFVRVRNARDEQLFQPLAAADRTAARRALGIYDDAPLLAYAGSSLAGKYEGAALVGIADRIKRGRPGTRLLILSGDREQAKAQLAIAPALAAATIVREAPASEVGRFLAAADLGLAPITPAPSMRAAAAVKLGEYLLCGLPVIATAGIGDVDRWLPREVAHLLPNHAPDALDRAAAWADVLLGTDRAGVCATARAIGLEHFGLTAGLAAYRDAIALAQQRFALKRASGTD